jgi:hypothetical protein
VSPNRAVVQGSKGSNLQGTIGSKPQSVLEPDEPLVKGIWRLRLLFQSELSQDLGGLRISGVPVGELGKPSMCRSQNSHEVLQVATAGKSVSHSISISLAIDDMVSEAQQLGKYPLLPRPMQSLFIEMDQALLVSVDEEHILQQIMTPQINCHYYGQILLFIYGETLIRGPNDLLM